MATLITRSAERLKALITEGHIDADAPWSFTPADGNTMLGDNGDNWLSFALWHLAEDQSEPKNVKARYLYPYGKDGKVYLSALKAIASRAGQQGDQQISQFASDQLKIANTKLQQKTEASGAHEFTLVASATIHAAGDGVDGKPRLRRFDMTAYTGTPMKLKGWTHPVIVDLTGVSGADRPRPIFLNHNEGSIVGHADSINADGKGITASGVISGGGACAKEVLAAADSGFPWQASIGARPDQIQFVDRGQSAVVNGQTVQGPINIARRTTLGEISFVPIGADPNTMVRIAATRKRTPMSTSIDSEIPNDIDPIQTERDRSAGIAKALAKYPGIGTEKLMGIQAKAISDGWTIDRTELELLRADRAPTATIRGRGEHYGDGPDVGSIIAASMCLNFAPEKFVGQQFGERTTNAAMSRDFRGMGLHGLIRAVIRAAGQPAPDRIGNEEIRTAFEADRMLRASVGGGGFSTMSLSGVVANVQNKLVLSAYDAVPTTWKTWCSIGEIKDFKPSLRLRLIGSGQFEPIGPVGEIKNMSLQDQQYSTQLGTEGALIVIGRDMLINDDTGILNQQPQILGRAAAVALEESVYTLLLSNTGSFFSGAHGNYNTTGASALSIASLTLAEKNMIEQVDDNGKPVLLKPSVLAVPPALKVVAENLFNGALLVASSLGSTSARVVEPNVNAFLARYLPVAIPWLGTKGGLTGASDSAWYLFADPAGGTAPVNVSFLNGQRAPIIQTAEANFNTLGLQSRAYLDFGVAFEDWRAGVLNTGV